MELLVLSSLQILGRVWIYDDVYEATAISDDTMCTCIAQFIKFGHDELYTKYLTILSTHEELNDSMEEYGWCRFSGK